MKRSLLVGLPLVVTLACGGSTTNSTATGGTGGTSAGGSGGAVGGSGSAATGGAGNASGFTSCDGPGTCQLFAKNCCGGYCDPNHPLTGWEAISSAKLGAYELQTCSGDIACPGCVSVDNPSYFAACRSGKCTAVDLREDQLSACKSDSDCALRWGMGCCEDCGGGNEQNLVAYNKNASLELCDPKGGACPPCMPPPYPSYVLPYCGPNGHCALTIVGP